MTTKQKWRKRCKAFPFLGLECSQSGRAHGSPHWQLAPILSVRLRCVLFSSPLTSYLSTHPRTVTQCKPVIARDELRTTNTNISLQTTLPAQEKLFWDWECENRLLFFLRINELGLSLFWQLTAEHFLIPPHPSSSQIRVPHPWQISTLCRKSWVGLNHSYIECGSGFE